jgi:hypothetical protein
VRVGLSRSAIGAGGTGTKLEIVKRKIEARPAGNAQRRDTSKSTAWNWHTVRCAKKLDTRQEKVDAQSTGTRWRQPEEGVPLRNKVQNSSSELKQKCGRARPGNSNGHKRTGGHNGNQRA